MHFLECHLEIVCCGKLGNLNFHYKATGLVEILAFWVYFQIRLTSSSCPTFIPELRIARQFDKKLPCKGYGMFWKRGIVETFCRGITGLNS